MVKLALISNHIILPGYSQPKAGAILVKNEIIEDIFVFNAPIVFDAIQNLYPGYILLNYLELYISPGIIDINVRKEWESYSTLTKSAISGGTTFILEEPSFYNSTYYDEEFFCDIGTVQIINDNNFEELNQNSCAYKIYFFPPAHSIQSLKNLSIIPNILKNCQVPLFIDPNIPDERMLYMSSPFRHEPTHERFSVRTESKVNIFAGGYAEDAINSANSTERDGPLSRRNKSLVEDINDLIIDHHEIKEFRRSKGGDEIIAIPEADTADESTPNSFTRKKLKRKHSTSIIDTLNHKIKQEQQNYRNIVEVESLSYSSSGRTSFSSVAMQFVESADPHKGVKSSELNIKQSLKSSRKRPGLIQTSITPDDRDDDYTFFLANCPEHWETKGVNKILSLISVTDRVHVQNISSAVAINQIKEASVKYKSLTCEVSVSHFFFSSSSIDKKDTRYKAQPPIRNNSNMNLLWEIANLRGMNAISSHHVCIDKKHKAIDSGTFIKALNGICSLGLSLQAIWTSLIKLETKPEKLDNHLVRISKWISSNPSKIMNFSNRGSIAKGNLADLIVWNPYCRDIANIPEEYKGISPFEGLELYGKIYYVYLRGKIAYNKGKFLKNGRRVYRAC